MAKTIYKNTSEQNRFQSISDFKWCLRSGGEVEFWVNQRAFGIFPKLRRTADAPEQILICEKFIQNQEQVEMWCDTPDEVLEYKIDGIRLRDIVTEIEVTDRTL